MIVDDSFVRIGSANATHRSMGVDTECDLAVDAADDDVRAGVRGIRDRLLADHLAMPVAAVAPALARAGSLRALIDARLTADHTLVAFDPPAADAVQAPDVVKAAVDPDEPIALATAIDGLLPPIDPALGQAPLRVWLVPAAAIVAAVVTASIFSPSFRRHEFQAVQEAVVWIRVAPGSAWIGGGAFVIGSVLMIPVEILVIVAGVGYGFARGSMVALTGSLVAAAIGYAAGRLIGPVAIARWMTRRSYRSGRQLGAHGVVGIVVLRLAGLASAGAIHLLCGAARVPFGTYVLGTAIGLVPPVALLSGFGTVLGETLMRPTVANGLRAAGAGLLIAGLAFGIRTVLLLRAFAPAVSHHRERARFG
jgi:uncharacterized membrane protein YdjX (TVP38/TMEM64 family)